ncbi:enoyl-CoA hydratase/isomerase family protein [Dactylosporangium sucinum]|uniref:Enoyl-CoA hydratase n=1 Tax=Dactylosporangium sucinum TaxID=1424081 RepID=A0A917UBG6_9ACTN|nr:enoyl-CoA hydratase-related protein [Dactylosporangium sucinum]GGM75339.1 enoyl-CoA hydratase [Dactylosporangium sucinum]
MSAVEVSWPRPGVYRIELHRPEKLNAVNAELAQGLHDALDAAERDPRCRVVVVTGAGRGFSAGLDLDGYGDAPGTADMGQVYRDLAFQRLVATLIQRVHRLPKPVVAAVNGPAAGFGLALVCAADIRFATSTAVFTTAFIRIGASGCDLGISWLLPRLVGAGRAHELMLTGRRFDAAEALRIGLLAGVVEPDALGSTVDTTVDALLGAAPMALELTKQGMWLGLEMPSLDAAIELENRQQVLSARTTDSAEARAAFRERRTPSFTFQ